MLSTWWGKLLAACAAAGVLVGLLNDSYDLVDRLWPDDDKSPVSSGVDLLAYEGMRGEGFLPSGLELGGISASSIVVNNTAVPLLLTRIEMRFDGQVYPVSYITPGNCRGGPVTLEPSRAVPISIFVGVLGRNHQKLIDKQESIRFDLIDAEGGRRNVKRTIEKSSIARGFGDQFLALGQECRGQFP